MKIAVVGAHLSGQPLNGQLTERNGRLLRTTRTAPLYRFFALANTTPPKPGLLRAAESTGIGIEVEVWELEPAEFGTFVDLIPPPLGIGTLELEDGELVKGFLVESYAVAGAKDITHLGGWRAFLKSEART
jgi:allophanate hydrolase